MFLCHKCTRSPRRGISVGSCCVNGEPLATERSRGRTAHVPPLYVPTINATHLQGEQGPASPLAPVPPTGHSMATMMQAVSGDTFNGLSGYKRPLQSNPTRIPGNQPAFRGTPNKPGQEIKTPAIRSSANRQNRGTNVCIPYSRMIPLDLTADIGRVGQGDAVFVSRTRPGVPGYAHSRFTRIIGVDGLNRHLSPDYWREKTEMGMYQNILVDPSRVADDWRRVPSLAEWSLDGLVLSNEEAQQFYNRSEGKREGHLYNIAIQGPAMANNGFLQETMTPDQLSRMQFGQVSRNVDASQVYRTERIGSGKDAREIRVNADVHYDHDYRGNKYHLYPLQMFSRDVRPMQELFVGLVATEYNLDGGEIGVYNNFVGLGSTLKDAEVELGKKRVALDANPADGALQQEVADASADVAAAQLAYNQAYQKEETKKAIRAVSAYNKMGWWDADAGATKKNSDNDDAPTKFYSFRYVLFTSAHMWDLDGSIDIMSAKGEPKMAKRQKMDNAPYDDELQRKEDLRNLVGAWKVGKVLDMKAGKMPWTAGGPMETGYRLTVNVNIEWMDWRALRRAYTPTFDVDDPTKQYAQVGDQHELPLLSNPDLVDYQDSVDVHSRVFQWPTNYVMDEASEVRELISQKTQEKRADTGDPTAELTQDERLQVIRQATLSNAPVNPDGFYQSTPPGQSNEDYFASLLAQAREYINNLGPTFEDLLQKLAGFSFAAKARSGALQPVPYVADGDSKALFQRLRVHTQNLGVLFAPPTQQEIAAFRAKATAAAAASGVAAYVVSAPTASGAASSSAAAAPAAAAVTPVAAPAPKRTVSSLLSAPAAPTAPSSKQPATGTGSATGAAAVTAPAAPTAAAPAAAAEIAAPAAPAAPAPAASKKRRATAGAASDDLFSTIFSGDASATGAPMQPLNPSHRGDGTAAAGSTGRSFQRRGKGGSGGSSGSKS